MLETISEIQFLSFDLKRHTSNGNNFVGALYTVSVIFEPEGRKEQIETIIMDTILTTQKMSTDRQNTSPGDLYNMLEDIV